MNSFLGIEEIWQVDERSLGIKWTDRKEQVLDVSELRKKCPCASCVDENTGQRKSHLSKLSDTIRPETIRSVGRYALNIEFDDGHNTGIYTYDYLSKL